MKKFKLIILRMLLFAKLTFVFGFIFGIGLIIYLEAKLPSVESLKSVQLQVPLRIYSNDGKLIAEYGEKRRTPLKIKDIPQTLIDAILATEDVRFYSHPGVDLKGIIRAAVTLIAKGKKEQGASTITMQVARNFFLSRKKTYIRKLNEILLALKIEKDLTKNEILELYLNKIYLGKRSYGVASAAETYYGEKISNLSLAQMAMIAGLPKAPSAHNPLNNPKAALKRREHVLKRMLHYNYITEEEFNIANSKPITAKHYGKVLELHSPYIAEMVRQKLVDVYGEAVYHQGIEVYTTIESKYQNAANKALYRALIEYDQRHGYRGHLKTFELPNNENADLSSLLEKWQAQLKEIPKINKLQPAVVISSNKLKSHIMLSDGTFGDIPFKYMKWAAPALKNQYVGEAPQKPKDVLNVGNVIYVTKANDNFYKLVQIPEVEGAIVSIDPKTGALLSLVGGFDYYIKSRFNRAVQAERQPGSNFKPFIYSAALENGYTAATIINDAPIVEEDPTGEYDWRPQNSSRKFFGPTRLRDGIKFSRNLVSIRLLKAMGISKTIEFLERFGFSKEALPNVLSLALGSGTITPLELATAYCTFPNGGYKVSPYLITKIVNYKKEVIFEHKTKIYQPDPSIYESNDNNVSSNNKDDSTQDNVKNNNSNENDIENLIEQNENFANESNLSNDILNSEIAFQDKEKNITNNEDNKLLDIEKDRILTPETTFIMNSMLQDVIRYGTGKKARHLKRKDLAGKTGSTNEHTDGWFSGFNQQIVTTTWIGFDEPKNLKEYAATAALPMWIYFMEDALKGMPETMPNQPKNIQIIKIDPLTGLLARDEQKNAIFEMFKKDTIPTEYAPLMHNYYDGSKDNNNEYDFSEEQVVDSLF